jgi:hypothetical protein
MRMLHLTSPLMRGPDVKTAQQLLTRNIFEQNYSPGLIDSVYGEQTMRAAKRAHYWVGDAKPEPVFGERMQKILEGRLELTADQQQRRANRMKALTEVPLRVKALGALTGKLGVKESPPGSNKCWASDWYKMNGPWCAMAVSWAYATSGSKAFRAGQTYAYVPFIVQNGRAGTNSLAVTHDPQPGDLACFDWTGDGVADHTGLFEKWLRPRISFACIEGNTGIGRDSDGGEVMRRERTLGVVQCFIHAGS